VTNYIKSMPAEIIIPCFNEEKNLKSLMEQCEHYAIKSDSIVRFVIVENGSTDGSREVINKFRQENSSIRFVILNKNMGYGGGILAGLLTSKADVLGWTHADLQTPLVDCISGIKLLESGYDFVKGVRKNRNLIDKFFSVGMGFFESLLFRQNLREINAQPTIFRRSFISEWVEAPKDFSLDLYALVLANKYELKIQRFPVSFFPRINGNSKWNTGVYSRIRFIFRTLRYSLGLRRSLR
jgi:glycosyltransferase involved in cell wall biosynthesis